MADRWSCIYQNLYALEREHPPPKSRRRALCSMKGIEVWKSVLFGSRAVSCLRPLALRPRVAPSLLLSENFFWYYIFSAHLVNNFNELQLSCKSNLLSPLIRTSPPLLPQLSFDNPHSSCLNMSHIKNSWCHIVRVENREGGKIPPLTRNCKRWLYLKIKNALLKLIFKRAFSSLILHHNQLCW